MRSPILMILGLIGITFAQPHGGRDFGADQIPGSGNGLSAGATLKDRRAVPADSIDQTTILSNHIKVNKLNIPQQTLHPRSRDHVVTIPKGSKVFSDTIDLSSRSALTPGVFPKPPKSHADLHLRSMEDVMNRENPSPANHEDKSTAHQTDVGSSSFHDVENTGNPRIPFVMPRPPQMMNRRDESSIVRLSLPIEDVTVMPSLVVPVDQRFPDAAFGNWNGQSDVGKEKKGQDFGIEIAFDLPTNNSTYCSLEFFLPGKPGLVDIVSGNFTASIYGYKYGAGSVGKWDTWNKRPQVDSKSIYANTTSNSTGNFMDGGKFFCNPKGGQAAFFVKLAEHGNLVTNGTITPPTKNGIVLRMHGEGQWLQDYGDASHIIFPPKDPLIPRNRFPSQTEDNGAITDYSVFIGMVAIEGYRD